MQSTADIDARLAHKPDTHAERSKLIIDLLQDYLLDAPQQIDELEATVAQQKERIEQANARHAQDMLVLSSELQSQELETKDGKEVIRSFVEAGHLVEEDAQQSLTTANTTIAQLEVQLNKAMCTVAVFSRELRACEEANARRIDEALDLYDDDISQACKAAVDHHLAEKLQRAQQSLTTANTTIAQLEVQLNKVRTCKDVNARCVKEALLVDDEEPVDRECIDLMEGISDAAVKMPLVDLLRHAQQMRILTNELHDEEETSNLSGEKLQHAQQSLTTARIIIVQLKKQRDEANEDKRKLMIIRDDDYTQYADAKNCVKTLEREKLLWQKEKTSMHNLTDLALNQLNEDLATEKKRVATLEAEIKRSKVQQTSALQLDTKKTLASLRAQLDDKRGELDNMQTRMERACGAAQTEKAMRVTAELEVAKAKKSVELSRIHSRLMRDRLDTQHRDHEHAMKVANNKLLTLQASVDAQEIQIRNIEPCTAREDECIVCFNPEARGHAFLPCGHSNICTSCVEEKQITQCITCNTGTRIRLIK